MPGIWYTCSSVLKRYVILKFIQACRAEAVDTISEKLKHKIGVQPPPKILVEKYLIEIAKNYNIPYEPDPQVSSTWYD